LAFLNTAKSLAPNGVDGPS